MSLNSKTRWRKWESRESESGLKGEMSSSSRIFFVLLLMAICAIICTNSTVLRRSRKHAMIEGQHVLSGERHAEDGDDVVNVYEWIHPKTKERIVQTESEHLEMCNNNIRMLCDEDHFGKIYNGISMAWEAYSDQFKRKEENKVTTLFAELYGRKKMLPYEALMGTFRMAHNFAEMCGAKVSNIKFFQCGSQQKLGAHRWDEDRDIEEDPTHKHCQSLVQREGEMTADWHRRCVTFHHKCALVYSGSEHNRGELPCKMCDSGCVKFMQLKIEFENLLHHSIQVINRVHAYDVSTIQGAEKLKDDMATTRDVSFEVAIACASAMAAPAAALGAVNKLKNARHVVQNTAKVVAGAFGGGTAAMTSAGFLKFVQVSITKEQNPWNKIFKAMKEKGVQGFTGGAAGAFAGFTGDLMSKIIRTFNGKLEPMIKSGTFLEKKKKSSLSHTYTYTGFTSDMLGAIRDNLVRQALISLYKEYSDTTYTSTDWGKDLSLAVLFAGLAKGAKVKESLSGPSPTIEFLRSTSQTSEPVKIVLAFNEYAASDIVFRNSFRVGMAIRHTMDRVASSDEDDTTSTTNLQTSSDEIDSPRHVIKRSVTECRDRASCCAILQSGEGSVPELKLKSGPKEAVNALQSILMELGDLDIDEPTGYFGPKTEKAVEAFQGRYVSKLGKPDGIVGPKSWGMLCEVTKPVVD